MAMAHLFDHGVRYDLGDRVVTQEGPGTILFFLVEDTGPEKSSRIYGVRVKLDAGGPAIDARIGYFEKEAE